MPIPRVIEIQRDDVPVFAQWVGQNTIVFESPAKPMVVTINGSEVEMSEEAASVINTLQQTVIRLEHKLMAWSK